MAAGRISKLAAIGTAGGLFSGLFGVGGGAVMVPLLILWLHYEERRAAATSLGAIAIIAGAAVSVHALYGNVHIEEGLLVGVPACAGVLAGVWLQQRIDTKWISLTLAAIAVVAGVDLMIG